MSPPLRPLILPYRGVRPRIHPTAFVAPGAVVVGDVEIGEESSVWYGCVIRGDVNAVRIGARTNVQDGTVVHVSGQGQGTFVGDEVTIGHMALVHACTVESRAFVGMKSCVMDGALVEEGAMVAAGALVTPGKRVPAGEVWGGNPARRLREVRPEEAEGWVRSWTGYVEMARGHLDALA